MTPTSSLACFTCGMDSRFSAMALIKPSQPLRRDLKEAAALRKWSSENRMQANVTLSEAGHESDDQEPSNLATKLRRSRI